MAVVMSLMLAEGMQNDAFRIPPPAAHQQVVERAGACGADGDADLAPDAS